MSTETMLQCMKILVPLFGLWWAQQVTGDWCTGDWCTGDWCTGVLVTGVLVLLLFLMPHYTFCGCHVAQYLLDSLVWMD
jgi:hypothetical protein